MHIYKSYFDGARGALAVGVVALLAGVPGLAAAAKPADKAFEPTVADYLSVYDALQNYRFGVEKHDQKALENAFWKDGVNISVPTPGGPEIRTPLKDIGRLQVQSGKPGPDGRVAAPAGIDVWQMPLDSYVHFESPTRATHFEYFLTLYPQPEKKGEGISNMQARASIVGWPGHHEDTFEKRKGEWRILQRKTMVNQ